MYRAVHTQQIMSRVDQREMREGLRKISQLPPFRRVVFLGQKTDVVAQGQKSFE